MKSRSEILDRFVEAFLFYAIMDYSKNLDLADIKYFCEFDQIFKIEQWRDIPNYEGIYQVSDLGRVKSLNRKILNKGSNCINNIKGLILKQGMSSVGYYTVALSNIGKTKTFCVHQLVSIGFFNHKPCGYKLVINHKNFIKLDNRKLNLEIVTNRENSNQKHLKSTSDYVGVSWCRGRNKWLAQISINGKSKYIGRFYNEVDAYNSYQNALNLIKQEL